MKILNFNDTHIGGVNSISRTGNMYEDFMLKLDETVELSKKCDLVIHSGDVFHTNLVANSVLDDFLDKVESAKVPWYILPGNHDMIGARWETSSGTSLAHIFRRSKIVKQLTELEFDNLYIKGYPYYHNIENDIKEKGLITESKKQFNLAVTHAFISPKPFREDVLHVEIKDINCNYDYVLCSHFHEDWGIVYHNDVGYINVGAWGRRTITEYKHKPKVTIITIDKKKMDYEFIELKSAKEGKLVFDIDSKELLKNNEKEMELFINSLRDFKEQNLDLRGAIEFIGKENKIERNVIDRILEKLKEVEK
jgi:DNA repair exonuclease SbcCD nuclease subunit